MAACGKSCSLLAVGSGGTSRMVTSDKGQRVDKWLWFARFAKTRTLAAGIVSAGRIRVNRAKISKPSTVVRQGDVITASIGRNVRIVKVIGLGVRRGPAAEAMALFEDLTPPLEATISETSRGRPLATFGARPPGSGRPTKRDRRLIDRWRRGGG